MDMLPPIGQLAGEIYGALGKPQQPARVKKNLAYASIFASYAFSADVESSQI